MRTIVTLSAGLLVLGIGLATAHAQKKAPPAAASGTRYFQFSGELFDGLQDDGFLRETRQGGKVVTAVLDLCYSVSATSSRKDQFSVELKPEAGKLVGKTTSLEDKVPISVSLTRKATGATFAFEGTITHGTVEEKIAVEDKNDVSEAEYKESLPAEDAIENQSVDFTSLSPGDLDVLVERASATALVKELRSQNVKIELGGLVAGCPQLRSGKQLVKIRSDPERAPALLAKLKTLPGVVGAGWALGTNSMDNAVRLAAADWNSNGKLDREKFASAVGASVAKMLSAKVDSTAWDAATGEMTMKLKRPSDLVPGLDLTEIVELTALVGPEKPGSGDALIAWIGTVNIDVKDEGAGPRLDVTQGEEADAAPTVDVDALIAGLARDLKGKQWDSAEEKWKP